ncbi:MAG: hypothetical protein EHM87_10010 [Burkholderiales bacterium]|nr:MAG: hypothetical protein EHM87_10010 [Burkholderiales bacterium]
MRFRDLCAIGALCAATGVPTGALALTVTLEECDEGADFIRNAALSRDNGAKPDEFLRRLEDDLVLIQAVPPALRWFVRDEDDEAMLRVAAIDVFADPRGPHDHHRDFLAGCRATVSAAAPRPETPPVASLPPGR